ncbi:MAG: TPM domain-containing protein, partial [Oscillospiraceae bacterium]|nr:TPM domain-containing protein [Oscillospiraceae bacterium]
MKKYFIIVLLVAFSFVFATGPGALALVSPSSDYYVTDAANVLSQVTKQDIINSNVDLEQQCNGAQIVIVTVEYLEGMKSDEYATRLFNDWGVGDGKANNGMLLLLATEELKGWLAVGAGIAGVFTDAMVENYLDAYFWPEVDARRYDNAVRNICEALFSWYADYYGVNQGNVQSGSNNNAPPTVGNGSREPGYDQGYQQNYQQPPRTNVGSNVGSSIVSCLSVIPVLLFIFGFIVLIVFISAIGDRRRYRSYHTYMGMPPPRYHWWYMWGHRPYRTWHNPHHHHYHGGPRGRGGFGGPHGRGGFGGPPRGGRGGFGGPPRGRPPGGSGGGFGGGGGR